MVLYALEGADLVFAPHASQGKQYVCVECRRALRLRTGRLKQAHFYHQPSATPCRLQSRSERHMAIQAWIKGLLPSGEAHLEHPFLPICRVADLFWEPQRLVFEVQCSPISEEEVRRRMRDYRALGIDIVWVLDDRLYNKRRLRPAEWLIRGGWAYFASVDKETLAVRLYDQLEFLTETARKYRGRPLGVDFRWGPCEKYFRGDRNDPDVRKREAVTIRKIAEMEKVFLRKQRLRAVQEPFQQAYLGGFDWLMMLLER